MQRNIKNDGSPFEAILKMIFDYYKEKGIAKIEKVDPPIVQTRKGIIRKASPFLDYIGVCTIHEYAPVPVIIEAKSTRPGEDRLSIGAKKTGITKTQYESMIDWAEHCSTVFVLWFDGNALWKIYANQIKAIFNSGRRSIKREDCFQVPTGEGNEVWRVFYGD